MSHTVWIVRRYASRYSLLSAMAGELADAFAARGYRVADTIPDGSAPGFFMFFNMPTTIDALPQAVRRPGSPIAAIQILVDHPLALDAGVMEATSRLNNFRLALPAIDGLHLLRLRWPTLRHAHVPHGIPRAALCHPDRAEPAAIAERSADVVVAGSIHSADEIDTLRAGLPAPARAWADEITALMSVEPLMPFEQAMDAVMGSRGVITGNWATMAGMWRVVSAALNRERRLTLVSSLQGLDVAVLGSHAWREACTGTIAYRGEAGYADIPSALAQGRVCLAWGPTQFQHTFSERLLLSMAAGCASVADDRYLIGRHFAFDGPEQSVEVFDPRRPDACRAAIESLLADRDRLAAIASNGRAAVERAHLWEHRVPALAELAAETIGHIRQSA